MAYDELEDRDMGVEETDFYEDETLYEPADTFAEQIGESEASDAELESTEEHQSPVESSPVEEGFAETLSHEENPHLGDQMEDATLSDEAQQDYLDKEEE
jgi:hypothetical protein